MQQRRVAVVTGGTTGIGLATARLFCARGYAVVINSRTSAEKGEAIAEEGRAAGDELLYFQADVADGEACRELFRVVATRLGRLDVLVNNAGRTVPLDFENSDASEWQDHLATNFLTTVNCCQAAFPMLHDNADGGAIVNVSSIRGLDAFGREGIMGYSAAKAAVNNFTRTLAKQGAPSIRVNAIAPGFTATAYMERVTSEQKAQWLEAIPLRRFIEPTEIAEGILFLAEAKMLTGTILVADAGFTLKLA